MPPTPPNAIAVDVLATQPTDADNTVIARLSEAGRDVTPAAYLVRIELDTVPEPTSTGWALYIDDFRVPKYWEYKDGIYFKVYESQFFADHAGGTLRFSSDGTTFIETGLTLSQPDVMASPSADSNDLPQQREILG